MEIISESRPDCHAFLYGKCQREPCWHIHPDNMDPDMQKEVDFQASTEGGEGCLRCLGAGYTCDKKGRDPTDIRDPCSECFHFGGPNAKCILSAKSQNDILFDRVVQRAKSGYTLPDFKGWEEARGDKIPSPMLPGTYRQDWQGVSRENLLARPDVLGPEVRRHPRAYLVLPERYNREIRTQRASDAQAQNNWGPAPQSTQQPRSAPRMTVDRPMFGPEGQGPALSTPIYWNGGELVHQWPSPQASQPHQGGFSGPAYGMPAMWAPQQMAPPTIPMGSFIGARGGYRSGQPQSNRGGFNSSRGGRSSAQRASISSHNLQALPRSHRSYSTSSSQNANPRPSKRARTDEETAPDAHQVPLAMPVSTPATEAEVLDKYWAPVAQDTEAEEEFVADEDDDDEIGYN